MVWVEDLAQKQEDWEEGHLREDSEAPREHHLHLERHPPRLEKLQEVARSLVVEEALLLALAQRQGWARALQKLAAPAALVLEAARPL